ncbi:recombinase family protein [Lachnospiraceae bacterium 29-84]
MKYSKFLNHYQSIQYKRAALYIRCSSEEQSLNGDTIQTQKEVLAEFAAIHHLKIIDYYIDEGHTARKKYNKRKEFMRMLQDAESERFDIIVFTKLDRWFRNVADYYKIQEVLEGHGISWLTAQERYETETANGRLNVNIRLSVAQDEADRTSERIKVVFQHKISHGELISGSLPLGYKNVGGKAVVDEETAPIVHDLFDHFELNNSKRGAMLYLMEKYNLHTTYKSVVRMLSNELYKGCKLGNPDFCPALIDPERFDRLQAQGKRNVRVRENNRYYVFTSLVECATCNHAMVANTRTDPKNRREYRGYRCNQYYNAKLCTHKKSIGEPALERVMLDGIKPAIREYIARYDVTDPSPAARHKNNPMKIKEKIKKLKELYINGYMEFEEFKNRCDSLQAQLSAIHELHKPRNLAPLKEFLALDIENIYKAFNPREKRAFWASIINKIYLNDSNEIFKIDFLP